MLNRPFRSALGLIAAAGLVASLGVHGLALLGVPLQDEVPGVWLLHAGIFVVFAPVVFYLRRKAEGDDPMGIFKGMRPWASVALVVLGIYAFLNFFMAMSSLGEGSAELRDGKYVLQNKGRLIREISASEYKANRAATLRAFSGHWMLFYAVPCFVFLFRRPPDEA
jgi:drug/metabolite transporter (DMT)-like permease